MGLDKWYTCSTRTNSRLHCSVNWPTNIESVAHHPVDEYIETPRWSNKRVFVSNRVSDQALNGPASIATVEESLLVCLLAQCDATNVMNHRLRNYQSATDSTRKL